MLLQPKTMTLQELINKKKTEFDLGCNTDNISDPPSDKQWIKSFLTQAMREAAEGAIEAMEKAKWVIHEVHGEGGRTLDGQTL